jgi:hypothetical protein
MGRLARIRVPNFELASCKYNFPPLFFRNAWFLETEISDTRMSQSVPRPSFSLSLLWRLTAWKDRLSVNVLGKDSITTNPEPGVGISRTSRLSPLISTETGNRSFHNSHFKDFQW